MKQKIPRKFSTLIRGSNSVSRRTQLLSLAVVVGLVTAVGITVIQYSRAAPANFVYRDGRNLMLNGKPYKFVGFNAFGLTGCHTGSPDSQAVMDQYFSGLRPMSMTRTWAFESVSADGIDRAVKTAEKYNQKVILAIGEGAGYCGAPHYDANWYRNGYQGAYYSWIRTLVPKYKDSPAVIWELMNEPGQDSGGGMSQSDMKAFYNNSAQLIKSLDPNHLISTGALDSYQSWQSGTSGYADVHSSPYIDLVSMHEYEYYDSGNTGIAGRWNQNLAAANQLNKPIFIGEFGTVPQNGCVTAAQRSSLAKGKFDAYMNNQAAGVLFWTLTNPGDDGTTCSSYSSKDTYGSPVYQMARSYSNSNLPTPNGTGTGTTPTPTPTPTVPATPTPTPPPATAGTVNDSNFTYNGTWAASTDAAKYNGDDHYSSTTGSTYSLAFTGAQVKVYMAKASHHGIAGIKIDSGAEVNVDLYAVDRAESQLVYTSPALSNSSHTVTVRVTGTHNAASTDNVVNADRIDVVATATTPTPTVAPTPTPTPVANNPDLNADLKVNVFDLSILLSHWGTNQSGDIDKNGTVNVFDLSKLLTAWTG